jgi:hypothetical protein
MCRAGREMWLCFSQRHEGTGQEQEDLDDLAEPFAEDVTYEVSPRDPKKSRHGVESSDT